MSTPSANIGKFLQNVFTKEKKDVIDLKKLEEATKIQSRNNKTSKAFLTALRDLDTDSFNGSRSKDGYLSGDELTSFFSFLNKKRLNAPGDESGFAAYEINITEGKLTDIVANQDMAEVYLTLNAILDPKANANTNLLASDFKTAAGKDGLLGTDDTDGSEKLDGLQTNNDIVITEEVAKERIAAAKKAKEKETAATNEAITDATAATISKVSETETDTGLETWLKVETNAKTLKDKLGLTQVVALGITGGADTTSKDNLKLALNSLRELASMEIVKGTAGKAPKQPASLEELLILKETEFTSPFYKIRRDAALTILLDLTQLDLSLEANKDKIAADYKKFEGTESINKATNLLNADSDSLNSYANVRTAGPGENWLNNNINSANVTAEQIGNLAKINTAEAPTDRGKAWVAFYKITQANIKNFAAEHLLDLDNVKELTAESKAEKAASLVSMIGADKVSFSNDGKNMLVQDKNGTTTKYTIPIKTTGIVWDTSSNREGVKAALGAIFNNPSS